MWPILQSSIFASKVPEGLDAFTAGNPFLGTTHLKLVKGRGLGDLKTRRMLHVANAEVFVLFFSTYFPAYRLLPLETHFILGVGNSLTLQSYNIERGQGIRGYLSV